MKCRWGQDKCHPWSHTEPAAAPESAQGSQGLLSNTSIPASSSSSPLCWCGRGQWEILNSEKLQITAKNPNFLNWHSDFSQCSKTPPKITSLSCSCFSCWKINLWFTFCYPRGGFLEDWVPPWPCFMGPLVTSVHMRSSEQNEIALQECELTTFCIANSAGQGMGKFLCNWASQRTNFKGTKTSVVVFGTP